MFDAVLRANESQRRKPERGCKISLATPRNTGAAGRNRTHDPLVRRSTYKQGIHINQCLAQLANCSNKANCDQFKPFPAHSSCNMAVRSPAHSASWFSLREIARRLGISRNTVRRYLRSEIIELAYRDRRAPSALDQYAFKLSSWLKAEATKFRKQRRSLKQIHADLCSLGFEGSYDRVAAFARQWRLDQLDRVSSASKGTGRRLVHVT
jgi:transcriptional regulator with XRE-family HTH domain